MTSIIRLTFQEAIEQSSKCSGNRHLILGNGFSIDLFPQIFSYATLREGAINAGLKELFDKFETNDFEFVMRKILDAKQVIEALYPKENTLLKKELNDIYTKLSDTLVKTITDKHPSLPSDISESQYKSCWDFLINFKTGKTYTFNYDIILYWVHMNFIDDKIKVLASDDGFRTSDEDGDKVTWEIGAEHHQNIYYLHGALHIIAHNNSIEKYTFKNKQVPLIDQIKADLALNKLPLFVAEGSYEHKKERIQGCGYLSRSLSSLKSIGGSIFVHGHSLRDEDEHVFKLMLRSPAKEIYISYFGDINSGNNKKLVSKVEKWQRETPKKKFHLYDSTTANVWGK